MELELAIVRRVSTICAACCWRGAYAVSRCRCIEVAAWTMFITQCQGVSSCEFLGTHMKVYPMRPEKPRTGLGVLLVFESHWSESFLACETPVHTIPNWRAARPRLQSPSL
jgi:hypothetical protein